MGEFFLVSGLKVMIILPALIFMFFPAVVLSIAYSLSTLLVVDKGKGASEALKISNQVTYGNKWTIFLATIVLVLSILVGFGVIMFLIRLIISGINAQNMMYDSFGGPRSLFFGFSLIQIVILYFLMLSILLGFRATVYGQLASDIIED